MNDSKLGRPKTAPEKKKLQEAIGARIKQERETLKLSQQKLLEVLRDDYDHELSHYNAISNYEKGTREQPEKILARLADIFHVRLEYLQCKDDFRTYSDLFEWSNSFMKSPELAHSREMQIKLNDLMPLIGYPKYHLQTLQSVNPYIYKYIERSVIQAIELFDENRDDYLLLALRYALENFELLNSGKEVALAAEKSYNDHAAKKKGVE